MLRITQGGRLLDRMGAYSTGVIRPSLLLLLVSSSCCSSLSKKCLYSFDCKLCLAIRDAIDDMESVFVDCLFKDTHT